MNRRAFLSMPAVFAAARAVTAPVSYLDNWAEVIGAAPRTPGESEESLRERLLFRITYQLQPVSSTLDRP